MDIIVTSTGKPFYGVDPLLGGILCEAFPEAIKPLARKQAPTYNVQPASTAPRWVVRNHPLTNVPELVLAILNQEQRYPGPGIAPTADGAQAAFTAAGHPVPAETLDKFAALLEIAKGNNPDVVNEARLRAQNEQYSREQKERSAKTKLELIG